MAQSGSRARDLAERPLGLEVPEAVQLADALIEERLGLGRLGGERGTRPSASLHQIGLLPRAFVKDLAVQRMAGVRSRSGRVRLFRARCRGSRGCSHFGRLRWRLFSAANRVGLGDAKKNEGGKS